MKKIIVIVLALVMVLSLAACVPSPTASTEPSSSAQVSVSPSEPPAQKVVRAFFPEFWGNYPTEDQMFIQEIQKRTGIDLQLDVVLPGEDWPARCMLALMANDQADIIWCIGEAWQYFQSGSLLDITDVVPTKIPNLQTLIDTLYGVDRDIKDDNGRIYIIPNLHAQSISANTYAINKTVLDDNNKTLPETWDEVYTLCKDIKAAGIEYPVGQYMGLNWWAGLLGAYNTGGFEDHEWYVTGEEIRFGPYQDVDTYKEIFAFTTQFYTDGLIDPNEATTINNWGGDEFDNIMKAGTVFFFQVWWDEYQVIGPGERLGTNYVTCPVLYGPDGKYYANYESCIETYGAMGVRGKNREALYEFLNFMYSEEASTLYEWGVEGETYEVDADGNKHYVDAIKNDPDKTLGEHKKELGMTLFHFPMYRPGENTAEAQNEQSIIFTESVKNRATIRGGKPRLDITKEESTEWGPKINAVKEVIRPVIGNYINGTASIDSYDAVVEQMKEKGIEDCIRIMNARFDRYLAR